MLGRLGLFTLICSLRVGFEGEDSKIRMGRRYRLKSNISWVASVDDIYNLYGLEACSICR